MRIGFSILKALAGLTLLAVVGVGVLLGSLRLERESDVTLPTPSGPFAVGRTTFDWVDAAQSDAFAPMPGTKRELFVWIWYPASATKPSAVDDYLPPAWRAAADGQSHGIMRLLSRDVSRAHGHSVHAADVSPERASYPVVLFRGGASANVTNYSTLAEDLASHGYVVVGIDAPYRTNLVVFPDGRVAMRTPQNNPELYSGQEFERLADTLLAAWTADMEFVLNRLGRLNASDDSGVFSGRLDMTRVGAFGHSFGGAQAAQFCHDDSRCKAAIDIDGAPIGSVIREGLHQPFMFLMSDHSGESDAESSQIRANIQSIYDRLPAAGRLRVTIQGANHFTFSDDGALLKSRVMRGALRAFGKLGIDGRRQLAITTYCVHSFFDAYLKENGASRLELSSPLYPEIH